MYIAVAGNIGSGKTTLTEMLSKHYGAEAYFEEPNNPYIGDFYEDMSRWSFNLQSYFLASRIEQTRAMLAMGVESGRHIIQDRTIYEDAEIFARNLSEMGLMSTRDLRTYLKSYDLFASFVPRPDLLIYLKASVPRLKEQILLRGRDYETNIEEDYLKSLDVKYSKWISGYEGLVLEIDVDTDRFESDDKAFNKICDYIDKLDASNKK